MSSKRNGERGLLWSPQSLFLVTEEAAEGKQLFHLWAFLLLQHSDIHLT